MGVNPIISKVNDHFQVVDVISKEKAYKHCTHTCGTGHFTWMTAIMRVHLDYSSFTVSGKIELVATSAYSH